MRNLIITLVLVTLAGPSAALTSVEDRAWSETCDLLWVEYGYSCGGIVRPKVSFDRLPKEIAGYYAGGDTIHVSRDLSGRYLMATLIHEMVHYYDSKSGRAMIPGGSYDVCPSEDRAWHIEGRWWINRGERDRDHSRDWWKAYPHCEFLYYQPVEYLQ